MRCISVALSGERMRALAERATTEMGRGEQRRVADGADQTSVRGAIRIEGVEQPPFPGGWPERPSRHQEAHKRQQGIAAWMRALAPGLPPLGGEGEPGARGAERLEHPLHDVALVRES